MDNDPCSARVYWSGISAATADSAFAGVLAGLLIAAVAALLVSWYQGAGPQTIALFGSGVPVLALSTYLFTVIGALRYPDPKNVDYKTPGGPGDTLCSQLWSEWLLATASLFIGSAVLVCGLGWALVSYADNLAVKLCETNIAIERVEYGRGFFIRLNAWLSAAVTTAATALLIVTSVIYLAAIGQQNMHSGYLLFFIYLSGLCLIGRASFVIFSRTSSARRANKKSCAAYAAGGTPVAADNDGIKAGVGPAIPPVAQDLRFARRKELAMRAAREFGFVAYVAFAALLAVPMTSGTAFNHQRKIEISPGIFINIAVSPDIVIKVVVLYIIVRSIYVLIARIVELVSAKKDDTPTGNEAIPPANAQSVERVRMAWDPGRLHATTYTVVFLAVLETFFVVALTQGPLLPVPRIFISLFLGGLYPAIVLAGLSSSVPAAEGVRRPTWETVGWLGFIP
ncbi:MAG: hypothetical protein WBW75_20750 [Mycobacterium sp.]|uniref:hypothetical protein n=1 Tax=Mycobacterium sp. TaxID=1785 RepID=UPI003C4B3624